MIVQVSDRGFGPGGSSNQVSPTQNLFEVNFSYQAKPPSHCSAHLCWRHDQSFQVYVNHSRITVTITSTSRMLTVMLDSDATQEVNSSCLFRSYNLTHFLSCFSPRILVFCL